MAFAKISGGLIGVRYLDGVFVMFYAVPLMSISKLLPVSV